METEGVLQYRLLGSHPAASGRYHSFGFSGDTILVAVMLAEVVKQHQINLTKYKLDIRRLTNRADAEKEALQPQDTLHSYDRLVVQVSRRHFTDSVAEAAQDAARAKEEQLRHVEGILRDHEHTPHNSVEAIATTAAAESQVYEETADPHAFSRVTIVSGKALPFIPALRRSQPTRPLPTPREDLCVLCDMECFKKTVLPCCHFAVCTPCLELARTMATNESECVVCGAVDGSHGIVRADQPNVKRETLKREYDHGDQGHRSPNTRYGSPQTKRTRKEDKIPNPSRASRAEEVIRVFENNLLKNMDTILSQLDAPDPLTKSQKDKRRVSKILQQYMDY